MATTYRTARRIDARGALAAMILSLTTSASDAKDHFLAVGGGFDPTGNQLSIETNLLHFQDVLAAVRPDEPAVDIYFADGAAEEPDVQYRDAELEKNCPPARRMMAEILGDGESVGLRYRNHRVRDVRGPTDRGLLERRLRELSRELKSGDRLIVFAEGHGDEAYGDNDYDYEAGEWVEKPAAEGGEELYNKFDTSYFLWERESLAASEFGQWLDRIGRDVTVVLIMGQCYAGGFSHAIFHRNDAELGLSPHARCGFFAQVHDRPAAGCTPDDEFEEYGSYFWSALGGKSRSGDEAVNADFDTSGAVSFAEAHAYAIIESGTFDVPVQTSGALLRRYSRLRGTSGIAPNRETPEDNPIKAIFGAIGSATTTPTDEGLLAATGSLTQFATHARPWQLAILERLPKKMGLEPTATVEAVRLKLSRLKAARGLADARLGVAAQTLERTQTEAQQEVYAIWPELQQPYSPVAAELTSERAGEFVDRVHALTSYEALREARQRVEELTKKSFYAQGEQAKAERLLQTVEEIVLAANLPKAAPEDVVAKFHAIVRMEEGTLTAGK